MPEIILPLYIIIGLAVYAWFFFYYIGEITVIALIQLPILVLAWPTIFICFLVLWLREKDRVLWKRK